MTSACMDGFLDLWFLGLSPARCEESWADIERWVAGAGRGVGLLDSRMSRIVCVSKKED